MGALFSFEQGTGDVPVLLLHGFGGSHKAWGPVLDRLAGRRAAIAFDLPGHAGSLAHAPSGAGAAARAVLADLDVRGIPRFHAAGHSWGGAIAALMACMRPTSIASLTLLAPGGFGEEINHRLLRRFAKAREEAEISQLLEDFFGRDSAIPDGLARELALQRQRSGACAALERIVETFFDGDRQKTLDRSALADLNIPIKVIWGTQDQVLPRQQAQGLPGRMAVHIFENAGHMLPYELPDEMAELILESSR